MPMSRLVAIKRHLYYKNIIKKVKIIYFSKTITTFNLKISTCIELNDLIKLHEYLRSRSL